MKKYSVVEIFPTLQGEGVHTGKKAVFVRFSGCNIWSGREEDREKAAKRGGCALVCDTKFRIEDADHTGGRLTAMEIAQRANEAWEKDSFRGKGPKKRHVVLTGGEPGLQIDEDLVATLKLAGFFVAVETNGSRLLPQNLDWVCVSPKPPSKVVFQRYDEVKVLFPLFNPHEYEGLAENYFVQPVDEPPHSKENILRTVEFVQKNPLWRISLQTHKILGVR